MSHTNVNVKKILRLRLRTPIFSFTASNSMIKLELVFPVEEDISAEISAPLLKTGTCCWEKAAATQENTNWTADTAKIKTAMRRVT